jgi:hypothetical protein
MSPEELRQRFRDLAGRLYSDEMTHWRRETFSRNYLWPVTDAQDVTS